MICRFLFLLYLVNSVPLGIGVLAVCWVLGDVLGLLPGPLGASGGAPGGSVVDSGRFSSPVGLVHVGRKFAWGLAGNHMLAFGQHVLPTRVLGPLLVLLWGALAVLGGGLRGCVLPPSLALSAFLVGSCCCTGRPSRAGLAVCVWGLREAPNYVFYYPPPACLCSSQHESVSRTRAAPASSYKLFERDVYIVWLLCP